MCFEIGSHFLGCIAMVLTGHSSFPFQNVKICRNGSDIEIPHAYWVTRIMLLPHQVVNTSGCSTIPEILPLLLSLVVPTMSLMLRNICRFSN